MGTSPLFNNPDADIVLRSSDGVDFHVDLAVLAMASPVFKDMTTLPTPSSQDTKEGLPIILLQDTSTTLELLLQLIHPAMYPNLLQVADLDTYSAVLKAADKYQMSKVAPMLVPVLIAPHFLDTGAKALRMFAIANRYGMRTLTQVSARALLAFPPPHEFDEEPDELKDISARAYYRLLKYREKCVGILFSRALADETRGRYNWANKWWEDIREEEWGEIPPWLCCSSCRSSIHSSQMAPEWFSRHVKRIKEAFTRSITPRSVLSAELLTLNPAAEYRGGQRTCRCPEDGHARIVSFAILLSQKVERRLTEIVYDPDTSQGPS